MLTPKASTVVRTLNIVRASTWRTHCIIFACPTNFEPQPYDLGRWSCTRVLLPRRGISAFLLPHLGLWLPHLRLLNPPPNTHTLAGTTTRSLVYTRIQITRRGISASWFPHLRLLTPPPDSAFRLCLLTLARTLAAPQSGCWSCSRVLLPCLCIFFTLYSFPSRRHP